MLTPFHLAIQVRDLEEARRFYSECLGLGMGRRSEQWIDFDLFGHQLVVHLNPELDKDGRVSRVDNHVDGQGVPVPHFGLVMNMEDWERFAGHVRETVGEFLIEPYVRFQGEPGEQATMFFLDPSGNALEFKAFRDIEAQLFAT